MAKYGMYPQPVYAATLDDGRTVRMTVWQKANAAEKGFDWEACRRTILGLTDQEWIKRNGHVHNQPWKAPTFAEHGRTIVRAHLEQEGAILARDSLGTPAPKKARAVSAKAARALDALRLAECELSMHRSAASNPEAWQSAIAAVRASMVELSA